jgi:hypothetical protein
MNDATETLAFIRGCDVGRETRTADEETVTCLACGRTRSPDAIDAKLWQLEPPVCPDCLRWELVEDSPDDRFQVIPHRRHFAVYERGTLVCIAVYKKGALALIDRLRKLTPPIAKPRKSAPARSELTYLN